MQKIDKNKDPLLFELQFNYVKNFKSYPFVYIPLIFLSAVFYSLKLYELIHPGHNPYPSIPYFTIFIIEIIVIVIIVMLGVASIFVAGLSNFLTYFLLFSEAIGMVFVETTMECFQKSKWCEGQVKYQTGAILIFCLYVVIIWVRSTLYYPFYDNFNYISMSSSSIILFDFAYKFLLGAITNLSLIDSIESQRKFVILATIILYCIYNGSTYYCNPLIHNCWLVVNIFVTWTALLIYLLPYFDVISTMMTTYASSTENIFWYIWGYSTPCFICYVIIANVNIDGKQGWKMLFLQEKHEIKNLDSLYLMTSQLKEKLKIAKKSEQKVNDPLFKAIWGLVHKHNQFCDNVECPLLELKNLQIHRNDDFLEQKRLSKTLQSCHQFGLYHLQRKKDKFPNLLQLSIQIANYELQVFQNRQKGLLLYTQFYNKEDIDSNQKFTLYYLKKKIEELFIDNENFTKSNTENEISQFRHNIEVSVSMLAQFWYFLADPKCNLKKLYDLANVLFPLKIGVDNQWKNIQKLKNIESYNLYARYLIKMFNDKEKGIKILDEAKKIQIELKNKEEIQVDAEGNSNIGVQENGIIFLEFDGKNPGVMYQVNLAAERLFGYNKGQLVNRKVNDIMPKIIATYHDRILENYQQTNKTKMMNKERNAWGKSKDGYLFPLKILIKPVKNLLSQSSQVYGAIRRQTWVKQSAFLTLDLQDQISEVSSGMLGIFPELYGKVNLKKKMLITEIIPNFKELKEKMLEDKEKVCQLEVVRQFQINSKQKYKQSTTFNISMDDISFTIASNVGYLLKFQKTVALNAQKDLALSNIRQTRLEQNNFKFIYQIAENGSDSQSRQEQSQKRAILKYKGGIVSDIQQMAKSCVNSASRFFTKLPVEEQKKIQERQKTDFGQDIKTKRLQGKLIRQIHLVSEESEYDIGQVQKQMQENLGVGNIKPSELSSILERQASNKHIFWLKIITVSILLVSCFLCIIQYVNVWQKHNAMMQSNEKVRKLDQLGSQILYMKMFTTQFISNMQTVEEVNMLTDEINLLDQYLDLYSYNSQSKLVYSDDSKVTMMLGFALNKLISQANSMKSKAGLYNASNSHVHFVNYNTINGLIFTTKDETLLAYNSFNQSVSGITTIQTNYMIIASVLFFGAMIVKNILLRLVLKKKSEILQVFFQIPRKACTTIQKQCQKFIQRLSSQNQEDLQTMSMASQGSERGLAEEKKKHKQKKRTVMGEQKTTNNYTIATAAFLLMLMFFPVFVMVYHEIKKQNIAFSMQASQMIFKLQEQASLICNLMNSFALDPKMPLLNQNLTQSSKVIDREFQLFSSLYGQMAVKFYLIGNIFDQSYLDQYNKLSYENLCIRVGKPTGQCDLVFGQNYGLNVILSQYFNLVKNKYLELKDFYSDLIIDSTEKSTLLQNQRLRSERKVQFLLKQHWRSLTKVVRNGLNRLVQKSDTIMFALMLTMCIANFTVLLFCWLKFYHSLQQKIAATEYILTFIPIDQINRNPKIANYIKQQILQKR